MIQYQSQNVDLILEPRWIIPVVPGNQTLEKSSIIVNEGKIIDILPSDEALLRYRTKDHLLLDEHVLIPGLINLHTHAAMTLMRGIADDIPLMPWLQEHIWPAERELLSERFVYDGTLLACAEMMAGGVTCFNDMYFYPQSAAEACVKIGMRAQLGLVVLEFPTSYATDSDDYLRKGLDVRDSWRGNDLLSFSLAPHAPYTVENRTFEEVIKFSEQLNLGIHIHLHETLEEVAQSKLRYGVSPIARLASLGVLGPNLVAAHCVHLQNEDMDLMKEHGCHIAHCPTSNLKLASGIADISKMVNVNLNIGLGTDGAASNNRLDLFSEMRMAALLAKGVSLNASTLPANQVLAMGTINAAKALGLEDKIGSIEIGKLADLTAVRISTPELMPCFDPLSHLIYVAERRHVSHVWVNGELKFHEGVYANIEPHEVKDISSQWQSKLSPYKI